jgi:5-methylthioribose kinase
MALDVPAGYAPLDDKTLAGWLAEIPGIADTLGGAPETWRVSEVGDGNLNLVFLVDGASGGVCVKQALPYLRLVGEGWPLGLQRAYFEQRALAAYRPHVGALVPELLHYDALRFAIVMEKLAPHIILRRGMVAATRYAFFAEHITEFMARALFFTSDLALPSATKKQLIADFAANTELCKLTEDVIFTDPYMVHARNRWTSPQLDEVAAGVRGDAGLKLAVSRLKLKFLSSPEALVHGDLHTGSIMVTDTDTRVIDPEFAFMGPMGFDVGAVIGNLLLNYFAQDGHATKADPRTEYQDWVLAAVEQVWTGFARKFRALWRQHGIGEAYPADLFRDAESAAALERERGLYLDRLFADTLGFGAAKMIRRILGIAHNIDLELIADPDLRALCEVRCLKLARTLMVETGRFTQIDQVIEAARQIRSEVRTLRW